MISIAQTTSLKKCQQTQNLKPEQSNTFVSSWNDSDSALLEQWRKPKRWLRCRSSLPFSEYLNPHHNSTDIKTNSPFHSLETIQTPHNPSPSTPPPIYRPATSPRPSPTPSDSSIASVATTYAPPTSPITPTATTTSLHAYPSDIINISPSRAHLPPPLPLLQSPDPYRPPPRRPTYTSTHYTILTPLELAQPFPYTQKLHEEVTSGEFPDFKEVALDRGNDVQWYERWMVRFEGDVKGKREWATRLGESLGVARERAARGFLIRCGKRFDKMDLFWA